MNRFVSLALLSLLASVAGCGGRPSSSSSPRGARLDVVTSFTPPDPTEIRPSIDADSAAGPPRAGAAGQGPQAANPGRAAVLNETDLDVCEAVFRHLFAHNESAAKDKAKAYCLSLPGGRDPAPAFLARFAGQSPQVRPGSTFKVGQGLLRFSASTIDWVDDRTVDVSGGYYEGNTSASGTTYRVERKADRWEVTERGPKMIS